MVSFGDNAVMAIRLAELVVSGHKRATTGLLRDCRPGGTPQPRLGGYVVLVDGDEQPRAIWRTTEVHIRPLASVDSRFAWDEGEGDRTRDWWLAAHRTFFGGQAEVEGFQMHDDIETVFERFEVLWPPEIADRPHGELAGDV